MGRHFRSIDIEIERSIRPILEHWAFNEKFRHFRVDRQALDMKDINLVCWSLAGWLALMKGRTEWGLQVKKLILQADTITEIKAGCHSNNLFFDFSSYLK